MIATTETMSVANTVRQEYAKKVAEESKNSGVALFKRWKHNRAPKGFPRENHMALDGTEIGIDEFFTIEGEEGVWKASAPYATNLPPSQVISCRCELEYVWRNNE